MTSPNDDALPYIFDLIWDLKTKDELLKALESPGCDPDMVFMAKDHGYISQEYQGQCLTPAEKATLVKLRARGFAVAVFSPEELDAENPHKVEEAMVRYAIEAFGVAWGGDVKEEG